VWSLHHSAISACVSESGDRLIHLLQLCEQVAECLGVDPRAPEALKELLPPASSIGYSAALAAGRQALTLGRQHLRYDNTLQYITSLIRYS
jgi:hypothetical protein